MRRTVISAITLGALIVAACGGGSESNEEPTAVAVATSTSDASATASIVPQTTAVSAAVTPTATVSVADSTPVATSTVATSPTSIATTAASATQAPTSSAPPPPPTATAPSGNPLAASVGVTGTARYFWSPASVKVAPGGTVTFAWSGTVPHDLKVPGIGFEAAPTANASHTLTFPNAGTYQVICIIHEDTMKGTVTVQ